MAYSGGSKTTTSTSRGSTRFERRSTPRAARLLAYDVARARGCPRPSTRAARARRQGHACRRRRPRRRHGAPRAGAGDAAGPDGGTCVRGAALDELATSLIVLASVVAARGRCMGSVSDGSESLSASSAAIWHLALSPPGAALPDAAANALRQNEKEITHPRTPSKIIIGREAAGSSTAMPPAGFEPALPP